MGLPWVLLSLGVLQGAEPEPVAGAGVESDPGLRWTLGRGLQASTGDFEARIRPRFHFDLVDPRMGEIAEVTGGRFEESIGVRRARLLSDFRFRDGTPLEHWSLRAQLDFVASEMDWKDLALGYSGLPTLTAGATSLLRLGQFREGFGLEAMTSVSHLGFIERSAASNAFTPGRSRGLQWSELGTTSLVQVGVFRRAEGEPFANELRDERALTLRGLWQPGRRGRPGDAGARGVSLVQLGGSVTLRDAEEDGLRFSARPGSRFLDRTVDTGVLQGAEAVVVGAEALVQWGRSTVVMEGFGAAVELEGGDRATFQGGHVGYSRFLGGRGVARWNRSRGGLRAPEVADLLVRDAGGRGAVEAVVRLAWVDLGDGDVAGGESVDVEAGVNWYLQPGTRFMLHWLGARVDGGSGGSGFGSAVLARIQVQL